MFKNQRKKLKKSQPAMGMGTACEILWLSGDGRGE